MKNRNSNTNENQNYNNNINNIDHIDWLLDSSGGYIVSSKVDDGYCDCCNGRDELGSNEDGNSNSNNNNKSNKRNCKPSTTINCG